MRAFLASGLPSALSTPSPAWLARLLASCLGHTRHLMGGFLQTAAFRRSRGRPDPVCPGRKRGGSGETLEEAATEHGENEAGRAVCAPEAPRLRDAGSHGGTSGNSRGAPLLLCTQVNAGRAPLYQHRESTSEAPERGFEAEACSVHRAGRCLLLELAVFVTRPFPSEAVDLDP